MPYFTRNTRPPIKNTVRKKKETRATVTVNGNDRTFGNVNTIYMAVK